MTVRNYSNTAAQSTLNAAIGATDTSFTLVNYSGDPTPPFTAALARGTATEEVVLVTGVVGSTVTVTRGYDGTNAQAQSAGATFQEVVAAIDFREANNHVNSGSTGAHGTTSQLVGVSDTQTLTNKTLTSPTITAPTVTGTATLATANVTTLTVSGTTSLAGFTASGSGSVSGTLSVTGNTTLSGTLSAGNTTAPVVEATTALLLDQQASDYAGVASKSGLWTKAGGGLFTRLGTTGAVTRLPQVWSAGTAFPASPLVGDTVLRTDVGTNGTVYSYVGGSAGVNGWVVAQQMVIATSTTLPASAASYPGLKCYSTDDDRYYEYKGTAWTWPRAAQGELARIDYTTAAGGQPLGNAFNELTAFRLTTPYIAPNRKVKVTLTGLMSSPSTGVTYTLFLFQGTFPADSSTALRGWHIDLPQGSGLGTGFVITRTLSTTSALTNQLWTVGGQLASSGAPVVSLYGNTSVGPCQFIVEDCGAV